MLMSFLSAGVLPSIDFVRVGTRLFADFSGTITPAIPKLGRLLPEVSRFSRKECKYMPSSITPPEQDIARVPLCSVLR